MKMHLVYLGKTTLCGHELTSLRGMYSLYIFLDKHVNKGSFSALFHICILIF